MLCGAEQRVSGSGIILGDPHCGLAQLALSPGAKIGDVTCAVYGSR